MPRIRPGMRKPPPGFEEINDKLDEYELFMKEAVQAPALGVLAPPSAPHQQENKEKVSKTRKRGREAPEEGTEIEESSKYDREEEKPDHSYNAEESRTAEHKEVEQTGDSFSTEPDGLHEVVEREQEVPPLWRVAQISRDRTRYVYNARYRHNSISQEVYDYCCEMQFIDAGLARRWRLPGYEKLCCTACGIPGAASSAAQLTMKLALRDKASSHRGPRGGSDKRGEGGSSDEGQRTCICRVPSGQRRGKHFGVCTVCGCNGCSSSQS